MTDYDKESFIEYLENTLVPDLKESGQEYTALDFEIAICFVRGAEKVATNFETMQPWPSSTARPRVVGKDDATVEISRAALSTLCELAGYRIDQWRQVATGRDPMERIAEFYETESDEASVLVAILSDSLEAGRTALDCN